MYINLILVKIQIVKELVIIPYVKSYKIMNP
jgi:hypothetical protein